MNTDAAWRKEVERNLRVIIDIDNNEAPRSPSYQRGCVAKMRAHARSALAALQSAP